MVLPGRAPGRARRRDERGLALIEFALALPLLAILVLGAVDLGRAYSLATRLTNSAREAARFAQDAPEQVATTGVCVAPDSITWMATHEDGSNTWTVNVDKMVSGSATPLTGCRTMQDPAATVRPGDRIRVRVSSSFAILTPLVAQLVGNQLTITGTQEVVVQGR
jgi:Flp pilus assembly protein TadG